MKTLFISLCCSTYWWVSAFSCLWMKLTSHGIMRTKADRLGKKMWSRPVAAVPCYVVLLRDAKLRSLMSSHTEYRAKNLNWKALSHPQVTQTSDKYCCSKLCLSIQRPQTISLNNIIKTVFIAALSGLKANHCVFSFIWQIELSLML